MNIRFLQIAKIELKEAVHFYELEFSGLGEQFKNDVKKGVHRISEFPTAGSIECGDVRTYLLHRFPYKILYSKEDDHILIIGVAHQHRKPEYWIDRIGN